MREHRKLRAFELADEIAFGSLRELHYQCGLSVRLEYLSKHDFPVLDSKIQEAEKGLGALVRSMRKH